MPLASPGCADQSPSIVIPDLIRDLSRLRSRVGAQDDANELRSPGFLLLPAQFARYGDQVLEQVGVVVDAQHGGQREQHVVSLLHRLVATKIGASMTSRACSSAASRAGRK